jgi:error-prone DNA polymerase
MSALEETLADYRGAQITLGPHPIAYLRAGLRKRGVTAAADLPKLDHGARVTTAGSIIVRQRPGTAKGLLFMTLEDETGMCQAIITPDLLAEHRKLLVGATGIAVEGILQKRDGSLSVKAERFWALDDLAKTPSHDFR